MSGSHLAGYNRFRSVRNVLDSGLLNVEWCWLPSSGRGLHWSSRRVQNSPISPFSNTSKPVVNKIRWNMPPAILKISSGTWITFCSQVSACFGVLETSKAVPDFCLPCWRCNVGLHQLVEPCCPSIDASRKWRLNTFVSSAPKLGVNCPEKN